MAKKKETAEMVTVVATEEKKSKLIAGKEYEVTKEVADILVKAKRAKLK
jgi:hypothetical protein